MQTQQITVSSGAATAIIAAVWCDQISVGEDPSVAGYPTSDFLVSKPSASNTPRRVLAGAVYVFVAAKPFAPGQVAGYIQTVSGTTTFFQDHS